MSGFVLFAMGESTVVASQYGRRRNSLSAYALDVNPAVQFRQSCECQLLLLLLMDPLGEVLLQRVV